MTKTVSSITRIGQTEPFELQVSRDQIAYHEVRNIFGWQSSVTTSFIPLWENATAYTYPGSALTMTVTTSSASDNGASITIIGLDASYNVISDTVIANNAVPPTTSIGFFRIND